MKRILTDGQTIVDLWCKDYFTSQKNVNIYISVSNLLFARYYYSEVLKRMSKLGVPAVNKFVSQHAVLDKYLYHDATDRYLNYFLKNRNIFSDRIVIDSVNNVGLILFKNLTINSGEMNVSPMISETVGLISYLQSKNDHIPLVSIMPELKKFIMTFNIKI